MRIRRALATLALAIGMVLTGTIVAPNRAEAASPSNPHFAWYNSGVVVTYSKWDTAVIGASSAFTPVWVAASTLNGQAGNKVNQSIWYIQAMSAYTAARGQCLWVWVTYSGSDLSAGSYSC